MTLTIGDLVNPEVAEDHVDRRAMQCETSLITAATIVQGIASHQQAWMESP